MLNNETIIKVTNRNNGTLSYTVPDLGIQRHYEPNETKEVEYAELKKLSYTTGGAYLLENYLVMDNREAVQALLGEVEPEYFYTLNDVKELLLKGTLPQLQDCLDFACQGVIDLIKHFAVKLQINDLAKRNAIFESTGFNVNKAIEINILAEQGDESEDEPQTRRRATPFKTEAPVVRRRVATPPTPATSTATSKEDDISVKDTKKTETEETEKTKKVETKVGKMPAPPKYKVVNK